MVNDVIGMIHEKSISPFCKLSDRGLESVFTGYLNVAHLTTGDAMEMSPGICQYVSVIRGALDILGDTNRHSGKCIRSHDTAMSPFVFHGKDGAVRLRAREDSLILYGNGDVIDDIVSIDTLAAEQEKEIDVLQLVLMRHAKSFAALPVQVLLEVYDRMTEINVGAGEEVVRQDMKGDKFYFIREGAAEVWREELDDDEPQHVATLATGDGFGEEALILDGARNATVKMIVPGQLLELDGDSYNEFISKRTVVRISIETAKERLASGAQLVDVRYEDEWEEGYIPDAIHMPLSNIRERMGELDKSREVVVYCRSGRRSQVGSILLAQNGSKASSMDGGILAWPDAIITE